MLREVPPRPFRLRETIRGIGPILPLRQIQLLGIRPSILLIALVERPPSLRHKGLIAVIAPLGLRLFRENLPRPWLLHPLAHAPTERVALPDRTALVHHLRLM